MFFIVRSFLIPFGAPRWVGAPVPAHLRGPPSASLQTLGKTSRTRGMTPYPSAASPGMALPTLPRFPNHHPLCPCLVSRTTVPSAPALVIFTSHLEMASGFPWPPHLQANSLLPPPTV